MLLLLQLLLVLLELHELLLLLLLLVLLVAEALGVELFAQLLELDSLLMHDVLMLQQFVLETKFSLRLQ